MRDAFASDFQRFPGVLDFAVVRLFGFLCLWLCVVLFVVFWRIGGLYVLRVVGWFDLWIVFGFLVIAACYMWFDFFTDYV